MRRETIGGATLYLSRRPPKPAARCGRELSEKEASALFFECFGPTTSEKEDTQIFLDVFGPRPTGGSCGLSGPARAEIFKRDGYVCTYCGDEDGPFEIDHVFPRSRGGDDSPRNLAVSCAFCNRSKGARTLEEWQ